MNEGGTQIGRAPHQPVTGRAMLIPGWMSEAELGWLAERAAESERIVEVGSWMGRSARALADNTPGRMWCVDPWVVPSNAPEDAVALEQLVGAGGDVKNADAVWNLFRRNLREHLRDGRVNALRTWSMVGCGIVNGLAGRTLDMVFIDGDHSFGAVLQDIGCWRALLRRGGLLCGHDYGEPAWPEVERAVNLVFPAAENPAGRIWSCRV